MDVLSQAGTVRRCVGHLGVDRAVGAACLACFPLFCPIHVVFSRFLSFSQVYVTYCSARRGLLKRRGTYEAYECFLSLTNKAKRRWNMVLKEVLMFTSRMFLDYLSVRWSECKP